MPQFWPHPSTWAGGQPWEISQERAGSVLFSTHDDHYFHKYNFEHRQVKESLFDHIAIVFLRMELLVCGAKCQLGQAQKHSNCQCYCICTVHLILYVISLAFLPILLMPSKSSTMAGSVHIFTPWHDLSWLLNWSFGECGQSNPRQQPGRWIASPLFFLFLLKCR